MGLEPKMRQKRQYKKGVQSCIFIIMKIDATYNLQAETDSRNADKYCYQRAI